jgi:RAB6A-GEF complex partner protein 2
MSNSNSGSRRPNASSQNLRSPTSSAEEQPAASPIDYPALHSNHRPDDEDHDPGDLAKLLSKSELHQPTRVLAGTSITGSNRSSCDFQAPSNQSQETLLSEQASNAPERRTFPSPMMRQHYRMGSTSKLRRSTETLLMGYAQVNAAFTLDGALVDQTPFEEVKRKGFLGGQGGGGVVGVKTLSNPAGFLGGFSLNNLGESIGGFLGGPDLSSIKEMKSVASSRTIPLLSTPQSLLFVDLTLVPGEEKSFLFRYTLPKGLPASYKGKAIKIIYNLNIGVQGAPGERPVQAVRQINIPFKVFSGVSADGEVFGHDLMQPYVILQDTADTEAVDSASSFSSSAPNGPARSSEAATQDFLTYVDTLLTKRRRRQSSSATLEAPRGLLKDDSNSRAKEAIDRAMFLSTQSTSSHQSPNRFDIARNGKRIATIVLDRTLHRLGESVTASVDLSNGQMPCYSLRCALETTEKVNPALALRSAASIARLSRRVYRLQSENSLFAERIVFTPSIPVTATPTLLTSGVNLDWALRFEFVTTRVADVTDENEETAGKELLESVAKDDRGSILAAVETLLCETFEVSIPITVYGDTIVAAVEAEETIGLPI